ncbi:MAG: hypothetical protein KME46_17405 [Brasilonema angustatum HA4187-MV1]|nr:hypothetical protein [Brasilonema angustatum HA4187-MV1]
MSSRQKLLDFYMGFTQSQLVLPIENYCNGRGAFICTSACESHFTLVSELTINELFDI